MFKNKYVFLILFLMINFLNLFSNGWNNFWGGEVEQSISYSLPNNKPSQTREISIRGEDVGETLDIVNKNIDAYSDELRELSKYILLYEELVKKIKSKNLGRKNVYFGDCDGELNGLKERLSIVREKISYYERLRTSLTNGFAENQVLRETTEIKAEEKDKDRQAKIDGIVQGIKTAINESLKKENLTKMFFFTTSTIAGMGCSYYGTKLGHKYFESVMGKPTLVRESNRLGLKETLKKFWFNKVLNRTPIFSNIEEIILSSGLKTLLGEFAIETKKTYLNGLPFRNSLFYGLPGTGKTMFAKRLAIFCKMDYAILSGADFFQFENGKAITELHKFFDWSEKSKRGLIVFIDEADSFLKNRKHLDNDAINLVNAFLSRTGESSKKIMFIFATNHPEELDPAVLSRIHKKFKFPLPELEEREKIINLYFKKYIVDDKRIIKQKGKKKINSIRIAPDIDDSYITNIAKKVNGFSGRDIEQMISDLRIVSYIRGNGNLTKAIIDQVVDRKIQEFNTEQNWV